jgi:prolyl 4-hydroxylase
MTTTHVATGIFTINAFFSDRECEDMIRRAEISGFQAAPIATAHGTKVAQDARNNDRCVFDDTALASELWERSRASIPAALSGRQVIGLNERFRIYRYTPGQRFYWHADAPFRRENGEMSLLTFMVYLNEGYAGGSTRFESAKVAGAQGQALVFHHGLVHEGSEVTEGTKYVLRSDVMYGPVGRYGA